VTVLLPESELPTGRLLNHDPRNRMFGFAAAPQREIRSVSHRRLVPPYRQRVGSCVVQTYFGVQSTRPDTHRYRSQKRIEQRYSLVTHEDPFDGAWNWRDGSGEDTGTDMTTAARVGLRLGEISRFEHVFTGLPGVLAALQDRPVPVGGWWLRDMDRPDRDGLAHIRGPRRGGHQFYLYGADIDRRRLKAWNSWGPDWGVGGAFELDFDEFHDWIMDDGDATVLYP
jgi:hypothetical protein